MFSQQHQAALQFSEAIACPTNSTQSWHCPRGDGIRTHRLRVQSHKTAPTSVQVVTCASDQLALSQRPPRLPQVQLICQRGSQSSEKQLTYVCQFIIKAIKAIIKNTNEQSDEEALKMKTRRVPSVGKRLSSWNGGALPRHIHHVDSFTNFEAHCIFLFKSFYRELHLQPPSSPPQRLLGGWKFQPSRSSWRSVHLKAVSIPHSKSPPQHKFRCGQKDPLWGIRETSISQKIPRCLEALHEQSETNTQDVSYTAEGRAFQAKRNAQARAENYDSSLASCRYICLLVCLLVKMIFFDYFTHKF